MNKIIISINFDINETENNIGKILLDNKINNNTAMAIFRYSDDNKYQMAKDALIKFINNIF